jgi:hypothetical protein
MMVDRAARKVGNLCPFVCNGRLAFLIRIAHDGVGVSDVKILTDQSNAKWRVKMVEEDGSHGWFAIVIPTTKQSDTISTLGLGSGKGLHPAHDQILGPINRGLRTIGLHYQNVTIRKSINRPRMLQVGGQGADLQSLGNDRLFALSPMRNLGDVHRRQEVLLRLR